MSPVELAAYDNSWYSPGRNFLWRLAWLALGQPLLSWRWIASSSIRVTLLRLFGARLGKRIVIRQPLKVKYPWNLEVGDDCWFGEDCWIDNLTTVSISSNVCISQGAYLCTGNHDWSDPHFGLIVRPIWLKEGVWVGAYSILTPGVTLGRGAIAAAGSVISADIPDFEVHAGNPACFVKRRTIKTAAGECTEKEVLS